VGSNSFCAFAEVPHVEVMALDAIARRYMTANVLPVIAVANVMRRLLPRGTNVSGLWRSTIHWGPVAYKQGEMPGLGCANLRDACCCGCC